MGLVSWDCRLSLPALTRRASTPRWTDFNRSDPGITLPGLFAFLLESLVYSVGRRRRLLLLTLAALAVGLVWWRRDGS